MSVKDGKRLPVAYFSRMLRDSEKRYSTTEKELLAVHAAILNFRPYLGWKKFVVYTDHKPLLGILKSNRMTFGSRWSKRLLQLAEFQFEIKHVSGSRNVVSDALSRVNAIKVRVDSLAEAQRFDKEIQELLKKDRTVKVENSEVVKTLPGGKKVLVLPQILRLEALKDAHSPTHLGFKKTLIEQCVLVARHGSRRGEIHWNVHPMCEEIVQAECGRRGSTFGDRCDLGDLGNGPHGTFSRKRWQQMLGDRAYRYVYEVCGSESRNKPERK